jgi:hypothetical protein
MEQNNFCENLTAGTLGLMSVEGLELVIRAGFPILEQPGQP